MLWTISLFDKGASTRFGGLKGVDMEIIKEALMKWGEAMHLSMENRTLFYSSVLDHWRVKKWAGKSARGLLYDGGDFTEAFECLLGSHAAEGNTDASKNDPPAVR
jgi:hypothetical protein